MALFRAPAIICTIIYYDYCFTCPGTFAIYTTAFTESIKRKSLLLLLTGGLLIVVGAYLWQGLNNALSAPVYEYLLFSTPGFISWMFRFPGYFAPLVVIGYAINISVLLYRIVKTSAVQSHKIGPIRVNGNFIRLAILFIIILMVGTIGWQRFTGDLQGILRQGYYANEPDDFSRIPYQKAIVLLDGYSGGFKAHQTGKPYINVPNDLQNYLFDSIKRNDTRGLSGAMEILKADAVITNLGLPNYKDNFDIYNISDGLRVYVSNSSANKFYIGSNVMETRDMKRTYLGLFDPLGLFDVASDNRVIVSGSIKDPLSSRTVNPADHYDEPEMNESNVIIRPFDHAKRMLSNQYWSRAMTTDPLHGEWHPSLELLGLKNWQTDYGYGLAFTSAKDTMEIPFKIKESGTYDMLNDFWLTRKGALSVLRRIRPTLKNFLQMIPLIGLSGKN